MRSLTLSERSQDKGSWRALWVGSAVLIATGVYWAASLIELIAYLLVVVASLASTILWVSRGRAGVPILPALATLHILYYAIPLVRGREDLGEFSEWDLLRAAATVFLYLSAATIASFLFLRKVRAPEKQILGLLSDRQLNNVVFFGLALGTLFLLGTQMGLGYRLGVLFGVVRSVALTAMVIACYFLGVARGRGVVRGKSWFVAASVLTLAVLVSWSSLFLVGGLTFLLAASVGFVTARGRIPWFALGAAIVLVSILHAGKEAMRDRYWQHGQDVGVQSGLLRLPELAIEWFKIGLEEMGNPDSKRSIIDRASLLQILLRVQYLTPGYLDYMRGETYALIPGMLVPRVLSPGKTKSQAGMDRLNIRYGLLTAEGAERTAVGWGLLAEGYANFGYLGVTGIGIFLGLASGALTRASALAAVVSIPTLMAVAVMAGLINIELDLGGIVTSLLQSGVAILVLVGALRLLPQRRGRTPLGSEGISLERRSRGRLAVGPLPK
jgi:hypothetical protein